MITTKARQFLFTGRWHEVVGTHFYELVFMCGEHDSFGFRAVLLGPYDQPSERIIESIPKMEQDLLLPALRALADMRRQPEAAQGDLCPQCFPKTKGI